MQTDTLRSEIPKIEAARRQLDEAIRLWIDGRDPLAIHTLTMAAFGILYDIAWHHGVLTQGDVFDSMLSRMGHRKFRELASFLKHADKDPLAAYIEPPLPEHEYRIGLALLLYRALAKDLTPEMGAFHLTMLTSYPELFKLAADPDPDIEKASLHHAELSRQSWEIWRRTAQGYLGCIKDGVLTANVDLKRKA
jgi:hypothetical protein